MDVLDQGCDFIFIFIGDKKIAREIDNKGH